MATFSETEEHFRVKDPLLKNGDYAIEVNSKGVPTGRTKQGVGKYYNQTPFALVAFDNASGTNIGKASAALAANNGNLQPLTLVSGAIDGTNTIFVWSGKPIEINFNTQYLTEGNGFTITGINQSTLDVAPFTGQKLTARG